jgi:hypothetical protein
MGKRQGGVKGLTIEQVKDVLTYDPDTGNFYWRVDRSNVRAGSVAGSKISIGYTLIRLYDRQVLAHRLAWFYVYGQWPSDQVDHINGDRSDNSLKNLRLASQSQNSCNGALRSTNSSGYRGVSWSKEKNKWVSRIVKERKQYVLGYFASKEEAYYAYLKAARELHGDYSRKD